MDISNDMIVEDYQVNYQTGYIKLFRSLINHPVFAHQVALKIWIWCLLKATHKKKTISLKIGKGETLVKLNPGQFVFGRFKAEDELNIDGSTIYKWIKKFESDTFDLINIQSNNQYSIITICNWATYQFNDNEIVTTKEQPSNSSVTTKEQPSNTYKNVKNNKNVKNIRALYDSFLDQSNGMKYPHEYKKYIDYLFNDNELGEPLTTLLFKDQQIKPQFFDKLMDEKKEGNSILKTTFELNNYTARKYKTFYSTLLNWVRR